MDLKELESFCMVARLRSFSQASQALKIGQPAVTKHVRRLEDQLGKALFQREARPVQLTAAGAHLLRLAQPLVEGIRDFSEPPAARAARTPVVLACTHGFMAEQLLDAVKRFRDRHPHTPLRIRLGTKPEVTAMVMAGKVDFGIAPSPDRLKSLSFLPLAASERVVMTPRDHALLARPLRSLDEIAGYPLILLGYRTQTRVLLEDAFREQGLAYEVAIELDSMDMVKRYVELGLGIGIAHRIALDHADADALGILSLSAFLPSELVGIVMRRDRRLAAEAEEFVEEIRAGLRTAAGFAGGETAIRVRRAGELRQR